MGIKQTQALVLIGDGPFAEIANEYFTYDSDFEVVGFAVDRAFRKRDQLAGLPVVDVETMEESFPPSEHWCFTAITYNGFNRTRARLAAVAKAKGYRMASYVSSAAFVWRNAQLGENVFIFEDNTIQPFVSIGDNTILWSGNHIGHHSSIGRNCFISSQVVISGFCGVGDNTFLGVNCTFGNNMSVGSDCWIGPGVTLTRDVPDNTLFKPYRFTASDISALEFFGVDDA